jgi:hypothetical protein
MTLSTHDETGLVGSDHDACAYCAPADDTNTVIRADDHTCPYCTYLNYCQLTPNHSGPHMCSQGHTF